MAQIREIKNRIVSVKKTQQITRAMKIHKPLKDLLKPLLHPAHSNNQPE
jgi:hypothetical protein